MDEDDFTLEMIDAEAEEVEIEEGNFIVTGERKSLEPSPQTRRTGNYSRRSFLEYIPTTVKKVDGDILESNYKILTYESDDDVVRVFHNIDEE